MKRLVAAVVTVALLALIFASVDRAALARNLAQTRPGVFALAIAMFIPQVWAMAARWRRLVGVFTPLPMGEAVSLILASQTMNLVLPSKAGDLTKALFLKSSGTLDLKRSANIVVFEKLLDVAVLALIMLGGVIFLLLRGASRLETAAGLTAGALGLVAVAAVGVIYFVPPDRLPGLQRLLALLDAQPRLQRLAELVRTGHETIALLQSRGARRDLVIAYSFLIWALHLIQIGLFFACFSRVMTAPTPTAQFLSLVPLAIFIGLLPVSIAGFGTRDAALIAFFPQHPAPVMLGVAMYVNLRYIVPAMAGLPFLGRYITQRRAAGPAGRD
ncbi:MAG: flippase-like domain-containing protein [Candidatus Sumerlaeaceae bacterium]|nr:flippase-like domain-containing protein [Candidatus Sumerlaeaceae bacterium]